MPVAPATRLVGLTFDDQDVVVDFHAYNKCTFNRCTIVYHGVGPVSLVDCDFHDCTFAFAGPASNTISYLTSMYKVHEGGRATVEGLMNSIRSGTIPATPPRRSGSGTMN